MLALSSNPVSPKPTSMGRRFPDKVNALVGSRRAPEHMIQLAVMIGRQLAQRNVKMLSGGAPGMDDAFERGYRSERRIDLCSIILPQTKFNGRRHDGKVYFSITDWYSNDLMVYADELVREIHPHYDALDGFSYWAHMRNCFQILGHDLESPVNDVIYWAPYSGEEVSGGTRTAVMLARMFDIPDWNMASPEDMNYLGMEFDLRNRLEDFI